MIVQINTDSNIDGSTELTERLEADVRSGLQRFGDEVTRVEVHLRDRNSDKKSGTHDMDCTLEARVAGRRPIAVSHQAATVEAALEGAVGKMKRSLESTFGRLGRR